MDPLRWTILGIGLLVLVAIYLVGRWREKRRRARESGSGSQGDPSSSSSKEGLKTKSSRWFAGGSPEQNKDKVFIDDLDAPYDHPPAPNYDTPFIDEDALQSIDDLLREDEQERGGSGVYADIERHQPASGSGRNQAGTDAQKRSVAGSAAEPTAQPSSGSSTVADTGVGPEGPWWQEDEPREDVQSAAPAASMPAPAESDKSQPARKGSDQKGSGQKRPDQKQTDTAATELEQPQSAQTRAAPKDPKQPEANQSVSSQQAAASDVSDRQGAARGSASADEPVSPDSADRPVSAAEGGGQSHQEQRSEPPPLKLSPASQVEMNAYRTGSVPEAEKVVVVYVGAREGQRFNGPDIAAALESVRMVPGEHRIWHRRGRSEIGQFTIFSVASMVEPGYLDPEQTLPRLQTPGLAFFMQLPLPVDGEEALDALLATAYHVSRHLDGTLLDSTRSTLSRQVAEHMREQLREHRRQLHIAMHKQ
ncbi:cell division protein ZipA C-terminal FtsZ-binding domain-containing protein [Halorhodospira halochloris]|uniref:cell division protein ZipA C-terminal FtsZ-binding domain-containing protein n=1 Tax=Halorhodospira halochloris TaxID=1052 RepID=UPI001EE7EC61|nr:cell division protein ZipA C-terminal FtsZ-binding domain-containing protein [Halorhodospira halochloris]MCG5547585.1 hypothetical protein [Halorhodospira halochloris]